MTADAPTAPEDQGHPRRWAILIVLSLCVFLVAIDNTVLNVALPSISEQLHASNRALQWMVDAYSLVFAGLLMTAGSLSDRHGRKKLLIVGLVFFGGASAAAAFAQDTGTLIGMRGLMGIGGAFLMPSTLAILVQVFHERDRQRAIAIWGTASALGIALGPVIGGVLVSHFWWGSVFLVNVPIGIAAVVAVAVLVPETRDLGGARRTDLPGALLSTLRCPRWCTAWCSSPSTAGTRRRCGARWSGRRWPRRCSSGGRPGPSRRWSSCPWSSRRASSAPRSPARC